MGQVETLVRNHHNQVLRVRTRLVRLVADAWAALGGPGEADMEAFIRAVTPLVHGAQLQVVDLMGAYLAGMVAGGEPATPLAIDGQAVLRTSRLGGVTTEDVYARSVITLRTLLASDIPFLTAKAQAGQRSESAAGTDVMLAQRRAAFEGMSLSPRVVGYRRVLTGRSCAFCATASTQRYRSDNLMPIHSHCDCGIAPIVGDRDPGRVINKQLLKDLKAGSSRKDGQYWRDDLVVEDGRVFKATRQPVLDDAGNPTLGADGNAITKQVIGDPVKVAVREHGELGPVLVDPDQHFTGPQS